MPALEGLDYRPGFLTTAEEASALAVIEALEFHEVVMHGQAAKRTVRHFGADYDYNSRRTRPIEPLPTELAWLRERCASVIERDPEDLEEALITRYPPGAGIGWHRDAPMFGSKVVGVSLRSECTMRFRRETKAAGKETFEQVLAPRSLYVLGGAARWSWQHGIRATPDLRYSVTFRTLRRTADADGKTPKA